MKYFFSIILSIILNLTILAQKPVGKNPLALDTIQISGYTQQKKIVQLPKTAHIIKLSDIQKQHIQSITDILALVSGIDTRVRGGKGVQSDISIRGGSFDQSLILLNGIPVYNPQTGHHSLDLPIDFSMLERVEILEGAAGQSYGVNAYSGLINLVTKNPQKQQANVGFEMGQFGYLKTNADIAHKMEKIAIYNGFSYQKSDGYLRNNKINNTDFYSLKDYLSLQIQTSKNPINIQLGYHQKDFGANSFYTSKYPWQYEKTSGYLIDVNTQFGKKIKWQAFISFKKHFDEFQLFRESIYHFDNQYYIHEKDTAQYAPGVYYKGHNYHQSQSASAGIKMAFKSKMGTSNINLSIHNDAIKSNVLGNLMPTTITDYNRIYTKSDQRTYFYGTANQSQKAGHFNFGAGISALYSQAYLWQLSGGFYINYLQKDFTHYININNAVRIPTFTDLYYAGPSNIGNPDLQPEKSTSFEIGSKFHQHNWMSTAAVFYRKGRQTIDWIKWQPNDKWQTQNLTDLNTLGFEFNLDKKFTHSFLKRLKLSYTFLHTEKANKENFISKYALDYLKHNFTASISHKLFTGIDTNWQIIYKDRNGNYLDYIDGQYQLYDYHPYLLTNLKLSKKIRKVLLSLDVENLFNIDYRDLSYIKMPGRWVIFSLKYKIK